MTLATERLPVLPLRDLVFIPSMVLPLLVGRPRSVSALHLALASDRRLLLVAQRDPEVEDPGGDGLHRVGTLARIVQDAELADGTLRVVFEGASRMVVERFHADDRGLSADAHSLDYEDAEDPVSPSREAQARRVSRACREYVRLHPDLPPDLATSLPPGDGSLRFAHQVTGHLLLRAQDKQALLERPTVQSLLEGLQDTLEREIEVLRIEDRLDREMRKRLEEDEAGSAEGTASPMGGPTDPMEAFRRQMERAGDERDEILAAIQEADLPAHADERARQEVKRLERLNPASPEAGVIRGYLDWILALPWSTRSSDALDVERARTELEAAHAGLDSVKDRILDHIAVLSLVGQLRGPILCLVGPPGVGKTSLGRSIARALGRSFVRVSLGGVRDEAEVRGHRRTYVGSMPGRILQGLRRAGTRNPVFLLDEVDKLTRDVHGDPAAALLEVLDPEQNRSFQDHYLELDFDLSDVLFVATANTLSGIPEALRDRLEIIRIPGYLDTEKVTIATRFLLPGQLRGHGLEPDSVQLSPQVLRWVIENWTREAGVRELDRTLARLARKLARRKAEGSGSATDASPPLQDLDAEAVGALLGPPPTRRPDRDRGSDRVGIATGLAWTSVGGEILEVEVAVLPGSGEIQLTGTLGDVMKESAVAAVTWARSRARALGLRPTFHEDVDVHIHIPEGATPKDGPSAGLVIACALISALTERSTRPDVAMTGEITLRGRVLPVGGIREKVVAALRQDIRVVLVPEANAAELERLPREVRERLGFHTVGRVDEALELVLGPAAPGVAPPEPGLHRSQ
ncbi:MAG: endopeptidase La [Gemmatimonadales bacterium]|nr:MAG: endopeptidase La [Gemmatimonadales bacterium]